ncbi:30S ribosomal protein S4 [Candidatus Babeliales bacterium]|nr:30S ribosomal protein S4 [Candidatus Babeliales bacterium]MBP9843574.1 30S ribosomal protein S4 [Candidatus Babeliales bacterium]
MKTNPKTQADVNSSENQSAKKAFKRVSEYGKQLAEKQKVKEMYGMREKQFRRFYSMAVAAAHGGPGENLLNLLERRIDNVVFRLKMATTRAQARQMIVHGHVKVNGRKVTSPSYLVDVNDIITLAERTLKNSALLEQVIDKRMSIGIKVPEWLELVKKDHAGKVLRHPARADLQAPIEEYLIVEMYSK